MPGGIKLSFSNYFLFHAIKRLKVYAVQIYLQMEVYEVTKSLKSYYFCLSCYYTTKYFIQFYRICFFMLRSTAYKGKD